MPLVKVHVRRMVKKFPNNAPHSCFVRIYAPWSRLCISRVNSRSLLVSSMMSAFPLGFNTRCISESTRSPGDRGREFLMALFCFLKLSSTIFRSRMARLVCSPNFHRSFLNIPRLYHHFKPKSSQSPQSRDDTLKIKELRGAVHPEMMGNGGFDEAEPGVLNFFD